MKTQTPVTWVTNSGKPMSGRFIFDLKSRPLCAVESDCGKVVLLAKRKLTAITKTLADD